MGANERYPFVVIRWMACVYAHRPIVFVEQASGLDKESFSVVFSGRAFLENGEMTTAARQRVIERVLEVVRDSNFRMCIVESAGRAIYVEPDGSVVFASHPPQGGLVYENMGTKKKTDS